MEITGYADVVLPECTYLERYDDLRTSPYRDASIAVRMPAAKPKYLSKPADWMAKKLAQRLGLGEYFNYSSFEEVLDWQLQYVGSSLRKIRKSGVIIEKTPEEDLYMKESDFMMFDTPTGMIELYSYSLEDQGFDPLPPYTEHPQPPEGFLRLNYGRAPMHTFARTSNNPYLTQIMDENNIWLNPKVANQFGVRDEQEVWLKNTKGIVSSTSARIRITERMGMDSLYMVHGFGHTDKRLTASYGKGINDTEMISEAAVDPIMGGTGMRNTFVTILTSKPRKEVIS
jgi:thiosulfate reductase/polysulfide reductase chain A